MSDFSAVLLTISDALRKDELEKMKFLCPDLGKRRLESIDSGFKLFQELMQRNKLGHDNTEHLKKHLTDILRDDLAEKLRSYERQSSGTPTNLPDDSEQAKLDIATDVIVAHLGKKWRMFGRKLGLTEVKIDSVATKHRDNLVEQVIEMLQVWRRTRGPEARALELVNALRACEHNYTADKVLEALDQAGEGRR